MNLNWQILLAVGSGGFFGAIARFYTAFHIAKMFPHAIPVATLSVNVLGSFIIGILAALFMTFTPSNELRGFLITGFLGALTTYSTFALETYFLLNSSLVIAGVNILLNVIGTISSVAIGYKLCLWAINY